VYYKDKKLCGILVEERENLIAVGIGLNVNQKEPPIPSSTTLYLITGKTYDLEFLAYNIGKGLMEIDRKSIGEVVREYRENLSTIGKTVKIFTPSGAIEGTFEDLDMDLNVILRGDVIYVIPAFEVLHLEEYER
jgi:biotin-(acetyl-CoA carboxylase) ligase